MCSLVYPFFAVIDGIGLGVPWISPSGGEVFDDAGCAYHTIRYQQCLTGCPVRVQWVSITASGWLVVSTIQPVTL